MHLAATARMAPAKCGGSCAERVIVIVAVTVIVILVNVTVIVIAMVIVVVIVIVIVIGKILIPFDLHCTTMMIT